MTPEREAQMREMFRKFTADQANKRAIERLAYRQDVALFVWLACARALEPMVRDGERYRVLREHVAPYHIASSAQIEMGEIGDDGMAGWIDRLVDEIAALEDGNATE